VKYTPRIPSLIGAWVKEERKRNEFHGSSHHQTEGELRAEGERAIEAHDTEVREPLLARIAELEGQVADAWEALVGDRDGYTTMECEFGPAGGPYVTVAEPERLTLAQFVERTMPELEAELKAGRVALGQVARVERRCNVWALGSPVEQMMVVEFREALVTPTEPTQEGAAS